MNRADIAAALAAFDGKHKDVLESLAARLTPDARLVRQLCDLSGQEDGKLSAAATWLLKRFQEDGLTFSEKQSEALLDLLDHAAHGEAHWETRLHLLQMLPGLTLPESRKAALLRLFKSQGYLGDPNRFVRAWSYNALAALAARFTELRGEVARLLEAGQGDEAAAVRARLRNIVKQAPWARGG
ncbi:hypothetical protein HBA54_07575 [Pelagibius litoralis]|uniref:Uncharacterized protein n=1 Tax=Pelagibius litoralis TaxID=374515 RepID=A0A967EX99_9PROT|nr:hypothetical protein [Pelagibius litoralis]NIA68450.1 hypothetical protein [Pelagibius litoralis]